jgi:hypothetical protein
MYVRDDSIPCSRDGHEAARCEVCQAPLLDGRVWSHYRAVGSVWHLHDACARRVLDDLQREDIDGRR